MVPTLGPIKSNQPKQNTETSKQSLEKNIILKKQDSISQVYKELKILKFPPSFVSTKLYYVPD